MPSLVPMLILPLTIYLSSCKDNFPAIEPKQRCFVVLTEEINGAYKGYCRCHQYEWNLDRIGRASDSENFELKKCDRLIGFNVYDSVSIYQWQESIRYWLLRNKRDK
jgi:hypothetical protein